MERRCWIALVAGLSMATLLPNMASAKEDAPLTVDGATTVSAVEAKDLFDQGALFIDPRGDADFEAGRIPGAVHLPLSGGLSEASLSEVAKKDETLVFYCNGVKCGVSSKACAKAVAWGFTDVRYFREGFPGWEAAGYPVE
ncbi:MAG: rhodanese-like domain-containing protein [Alphaproteobacteria bacterium]